MEILINNYLFLSSRCCPRRWLKWTCLQTSRHWGYERRWTIIPLWCMALQTWLYRGSSTETEVDIQFSLLKIPFVSACFLGHAQIKSKRAKNKKFVASSVVDVVITVAAALCLIPWVSCVPEVFLTRLPVRFVFLLSRATLLVWLKYPTRAKKKYACTDNWIIL